MAGQRILLGAIAGAYGVRGEVRVKSFCDRPEDIAAYGPLETQDGATLRILTLGPVAKGGVAARLEGVDGRDAAEALKGTQLFAPRAALPEAGEDEFYHADLIGLVAVDPAGRMLGRVRGVADYGAGDLLDIAPEGGGESVVVPFTRDVVPEIDMAGGRVTVDPPAGLFGRGEDDDDG